MKRVLLDNGKFAPYKEPKKVKSIPSQKITEKKPEQTTKKEPVKEASNEAPNEKKFELTGEETAAELKAMLDEVGVKYAKNAGKDKCMELIAPHLVESGGDSDESDL